MDERAPRGDESSGRLTSGDADSGPKPDVSSFFFSIGSGAPGKAFLPFALVLFLVSCASMAALAVLGILGAGAGALLRLARGAKINPHLNKGSFRRPAGDDREVIDIEAVEVEPGIAENAGDPGRFS
jgi:hypothetical protein